MSSPVAKKQKKILENPFVGSLMVPIAIVLVGALIIFGITKMLSTERSYKDLVNEIQSKTFGNKWVAAYELSKQINSSQIPKEDYPWLIQNLSQAYKDSVEPRSRGFIIAAVGALKSNLAIPLFETSLEDPDLDVKFHTIVSIANMPKGISFDWKKLISQLNSPEMILRQASVLALATHKVVLAEEKMAELLTDESNLVRYSSAIGLINFKNQKAILVLKELLLKSYPELNEKINPPHLDAKQINDLKLSALETLKTENWGELNDAILEVTKRDAHNSVVLKAKEVLNSLKNENSVRII